MISYFQFRETHYCDTARAVGETSPHAEKAAAAVKTVTTTLTNNTGENNQRGTNEVTTTQNPNQSDGVTETSSFSTKPPRNNVFGIGGTANQPNPYKTDTQLKFQQFTQDFASFLDATLGKITTGISETLGTERTISQDTEKGINEMGHGDGENVQTTGNCVMVGHTSNCFYEIQNDSEPSDNTEYGDKPDWEDNTFNVEDAENQDMPYGIWNDTEINTEGVPTTVTGGEPSDTGKVESGTWFKTLGFLPLLAIGGGLIYFARRKK